VEGKHSEVFGSSTAGKKFCTVIPKSFEKTSHLVSTGEICTTAR
jgi:hypothetical protein